MSPKPDKRLLWGGATEDPQTEDSQPLDFGAYEVRTGGALVDNAWATTGNMPRGDDQQRAKGVNPHPAEIAQTMPAARCKECRVVTWKVNLVRGLWRSTEEHAEGCSRPQGRLDKQAENR